MNRSLADFQGFVKDAFFIVPPEQFVPEDIVLGAYTFLPWVRNGIGATIGPPVAPSVRPVVTVDLPVQADGQPDQTVTQTLLVRGPGDVIALDQRQIVRRYPAPGTVDAARQLPRPRRVRPAGHPVAVLAEATGRQPSRPVDCPRGPRGERGRAAAGRRWAATIRRHNPG